MLKYNISIDMLRLLNPSVKVSDFEYFVNSLRLLTGNYDKKTGVVISDGFIANVKYWESFNCKMFRYNITYTDVEGGTFYVGYKHNSESIGQRYKLVLEYNPNKVDFSFFREFKIKFFKDKTKIIVKSFDIAVDFQDVNILNCILDTAQKKNKLIFDMGGDDRTVYCGKGDGRVKLYNKKKEQEKKGLAIPFDSLTRFETSFSIKSSVTLSNVSTYLALLDYTIYPKVNIYSNILLESAENRCMLLGLTQEPSLLSCFTRKMKEKYKAILKDYDSYQLNKCDILMCFDKFIINW